MAYTQPITPKDSSAIELTPDGTIPTVIDLTIHTGTSFRIREGTFADYHSQELSEDTAGHTSVDVYAIEGEWKIVESNENNLLVTDVASFPIARNAQYFGADDNRSTNTYEFPHHHMAPKNLSGTSTLFVDSSVDVIRGILTRGDYLYYYFYYSFYDFGIIRKSIITGAEDTLDYTFLFALGYDSMSYSFAAIDDDTIMVFISTPSSKLYFATYNFSTATLRLVCNPSVTTYTWHWAVIGTRLCISSWRYHPSDDYQLISYRNFMYDYTLPYGSNLLTSYYTVAYPTQGNMQYPVCNDMIIGKKYFAQYHSGNFDPITPPANDIPELFVFDVEDNTITLVQPTYNAGFGTEGNNFMYHLCENPFDHMIYYISFHVQEMGSYHRSYYSIQIMSPDNYSNGTYYEYYYDSSPARDLSQIPGVLVPGMFELYVIMANGDVYNVRDLPGAIGSPITTLYISEPSATGGLLRFDENLQRPQPHKIASCLDRWDRLWYIQSSYIKAVSFKTGIEEISMDAGIAEVYRGTYCFPNYNYSHQHVYLSRDRVFVLCRATGFCSTPGGFFSRIYKIE